MSSAPLRQLPLWGADADATPEWRVRESARARRLSVRVWRDGAVEVVVPRRTRLRYRGCDEAGRPIDRVAEGFHARVVQHECDHLDGILYPMRMPDMSRFGFTEELFPGTDAGPDD